MNGSAATLALRKEYPHARIILLTVSDREEDVVQALQAGAKGYLLKDATKSVIVDTIRQVVAGQTCISPELAGKLAEHTRREPLTMHKREILAQMAQGRNNQEIGETLFIAEGTVKADASSIYHKLGITDRTQAVVISIQRGLVSL